MGRQKLFVFVDDYTNLHGEKMEFQDEEEDVDVNISRFGHSFTGNFAVWENADICLEEH